VPELNYLSDLPLCRIAAIGALIAALGLAGCGRKGGLDPPPGAAVSGPAIDAGPSGAGPDDKAPTPAQPPRQRTPIDWLLD
jgi:predicted small lipoprotein YifL